MQFETDVKDSAVQQLRAALRGALVRLGDPDYEAARQVWNGAVNRHPALIVYCMGVADVLACIRLAREQNLRTAVRSAGHHVAGIALCDGGLVIDLSRLKSIRVDPAARTVVAQAGVRWGELDRETQAFGLATPGGTESDVGIAGLTLGGGNGWLMGLYGATCDNLLAVDIVTAEGQCLTASATQHADLFWGVRGGGGNFGIVTSLTYQLHPVGPIVLGGMVLYPFAQAREVLERYREFTRTAPDALTAYACLITAEDGTPVVAIAACYAGPLERAEQVVHPLRTWGTVLSDQLRLMPYTELQSLFDAARPAGRRCYMRSHFMRELSNDAIDTLMTQFRRVPSPLSAVIVEHCHGAIARVPPEATAFGLRTSPYHFEILAFWDDPAQSEVNRQWVRAFFAATQPFSSGEVYVNSLDQDETQRIREAYGVNYERLVALKRHYDPTNFFCCNHNIAPTGR
jgi:FAD/FMN-containing dehydrogenase